MNSVTRNRRTPAEPESASSGRLNKRDDGIPASVALADEVSYRVRSAFPEEDRLCADLLARLRASGADANLLDQLEEAITDSVTIVAHETAKAAAWTVFQLESSAAWRKYVSAHLPPGFYLRYSI